MSAPRGYHEPGKCRYCTCHGDCKLHDGDECGWVDGSRTVCTAPGCQRAFVAEKSRPVVRRRKLSTAEVHTIKKLEGRGRRGRERARLVASGLIRPKGGAA